MEQSFKKNKNIDNLPTLNHFFQTYEGAESVKDATEYYTTNELWNLLAREESLKGYSMTDLHNWLFDKGYTRVSIEPMRYVWLLKPKGD